MSRTSKFLARILRHEPALLDLTMDAGGWVSVADLLRGMKRAGHRINTDELRALVADDDKNRFTLSEDGRRIRAAQGHSIAIDLGLPAIAPPAALFHGTASANLTAIWSEGIIPGRRQHVHLSTDRETAMRVGQRHGKAVVLRIDAARMHQDGHLFWQADNGVWLTNRVLRIYLGF
jgi:putative RNA 2'-phosphotransferase